MKHILDDMREPGSGMVFRRSTLLGLALLLASCSSATAPETTLWEGNLSPVLPSTVSGTVAAVSQFGRTLVSIDLRQGEPDVTYAWRIETGTCDTTGQIQGGTTLYPPLVASESGAAGADASLPGHFVSSQQYAAKIVRTVGESEQVVSCGALRLQDD